ncbi:MAG: T9SS type A sorting domain-containing protein [Phaeodactylibacter sp.]|uniref:T9SS type A sorting domain-containing protein n=1 Tax=Phaeodactylibacter sp. TaxID=1940289 RepID=UPI0032ECAF8E
MEQTSPLFTTEDIHLYPNPAQHTITLEWERPHEEPVTLILHNEIGQAIESRVLKPGTLQEVWDVSGLSNGLYLIEVRGGTDLPQLLRFVKSR